ncbi:NAD-dependent epimerase/dehydratase family protein [Pelagibacterium halotolerans]|uniref:Putative dihydroflavonol-4-reductase n=1 Tax=Pelagibacterium halotolerans (strain DSM 22347 / JCM 15775 / CGMCC 1.7692 / B2) TaxID=1082931 RepID=G4RBV8_PELHB|nr:NAD-dependent epimerase/dehydratase family protein [Pelagibacterium halotolerans]AEQ50621.1 putative dihydroflavonol-4-reductase [Pelagibacterium halotolerans B2]QJR19440.1 NAD-dependent epimerase/dehydratase family protein [Pelagibacterium halotolerans]SDZ91283.1 Nucleoside-diphosphate-sugar epimerase [Pelagibacterium halotolerans]
MKDRVLLTGVSGFLGGHVALELLKSGYTVRGSVRNLSRADKVRATLEKAGADSARLEFVALDLESDEGWQEAMDGVRFLQHTASPFVLQMPSDKNDLIRPAVEGTERALNAALAANVERVVLTSSMAAIAYGHDKSRAAPFTANDWTNLEGRDVTPYTESKTRAERRAWEIMRAAGREKDLATINPSGIFGPLLDEDPGTSAILVQRLMNGSVPASPRMPLVAVDVRDVARAHLAAMTAHQAGGHRFPMGERTMFFSEVATVLRNAFPDYAKKIPKRELPDWMVRIYALFDRDVRSNLGELGVLKRLDSSAVIRLLDRKLTPADASFIATGESLIAHGLV